MPVAERPLERRPIRARSSRWAVASAAWLARVGVAPNAISVASGAFGVAAGAAFALTSDLPDAAPWLFVAAAAAMQLRLVCNLLDGMVAVEGGRRSVVGDLYNEAPDRVADVGALAGAGYALGGSPTLGWLAACGALGVAYVRALAKASGAPNDFCGPMAKQHRMALMTIVAVAAAVLPASARPAWGPDGRWGLVAAALAVVVVGCVATSARRLARAARALRESAR